MTKAKQVSTPEQAEQLSLEIGTQIREICDQAVKKANKILNLYSMNAKMQIVIEESEPPKKVSKRKSKATNL